MILFVSLLSALSVASIVWYFGSNMVEKKAVSTRLDRFSGEQRGNVDDKILKRSFEPKAKKKSPLMTTLFQIKVKPTLSQVIFFLVMWITISIVVMIKMPGALPNKLIIIGAIAILCFRFVNVMTYQRRMSQLRNELPGALDLITICLEAGLSIDASFLRVANELEGTLLGKELKTTFNEVTAGIPLETALKGMARRTDIYEFNAIVSSIVQAQKMGTALSVTFRVQSESLREQYRMRMKEKILKVPVKILFPLVLFVFPALFLVIAFPAFVNMMESFSG